MKKQKNRKKIKKLKNSSDKIPAQPIFDKATGNSSVSACLIVKNEEEFLENCLKSLKDHVNEIIVVDTGSTDNTVEIARKYTDKVYFHPWEESFSKARNQALGYAACDWVFQIDADEELAQESCPILQTEINNAKNCDVIYVKIYSFYNNGEKKSLHYYGRLFRNNGRIHYKGDIHEQVTGGTNEYYSSIKLWHYGYDLTEEKERKKFERTSGLLKKAIEREPQNPVHHHNLGVSYLSRKMYDEAICEAKMAIELSDQQNDHSNLYGWSHYIVSMAYFCIGSMIDAKTYAEKSLAKYPDHMDSYYMLVIIAFDEGRWDDVLLYGKEYFKFLKEIENKRENITFGNTINEASLVYALMGHSCYYKGLLIEMEDYYEKSLQIAEKKWAALNKIGAYHLIKSGDLVLAERFLKMASNKAPENKNIWYNLSILYEKLGLIEEEVNSIVNVINRGTNDPAVFNRLLEIYVNKGLHKEAMDILLEYSAKIAIDPYMICKTAALQLENGQTDNGVKCYMMALEKDALLFDAWSNLGEIMLSVNRIEDAKTSFENALSLKENHTGTILNLCDIASREADILQVVNFTNMLMKAENIVITKTLNNLDDLISVLNEIASKMSDNPNHQKQIFSVITRINEIIDKL